MNREGATTRLREPPPAFSRLLRASLLDLLRGRIPGGKEFDAGLRESALPHLLQETVYDVTVGTRLTANEQQEVARELIAHFRAALDDGEEPAQLLQEFGNLRSAARLIGRARRRCRPLPLRAAMLARRTASVALLTLFVVYGVLLARFYLESATPRVATDSVPAFVAEANAAVEEIAPEERAWPLYEQAYELVASRLAAWPGHPDDEPVESLLRQTPQDARWASLGAFLEEIRPNLRLVRRAAKKESMGFELRVRHEQPWVWIDSWRAHEVFALLRSLMEADVVLGISQHDAEVTQESLLTLLRMAKHARQIAPSHDLRWSSQFLIDRAVHHVARLMRADADLLTSNHLVELAESFRSLGNAEDFRPRTLLERETARRAWARARRVAADARSIDATVASTGAEGPQRRRGAAL